MQGDGEEAVVEPFFAVEELMSPTVAVKCSSQNSTLAVESLMAPPSQVLTAAERSISNSTSVKSGSATGSSARCCAAA